MMHMRPGWGVGVFIAPALSTLSGMERFSLGELSMWVWRWYVLAPRQMLLIAMQLSLEKQAALGLSSRADTHTPHRHQVSLAAAIQDLRHKSGAFSISRHSCSPGAASAGSAGACTWLPVAAGGWHAGGPRHLPGLS